jgi:hypothetical protein
LGLASSTTAPGPPLGIKVGERLFVSHSPREEVRRTGMIQGERQVFEMASERFGAGGTEKRA